MNDWNAVFSRVARHHIEAVHISLLFDEKKTHCDALTCHYDLREKNVQNCILLTLNSKLAFITDEMILDKTPFYMKALEAFGHVIHTC